MALLQIAASVLRRPLIDIRWTPQPNFSLIGRSEVKPKPQAGDGHTSQGEVAKLSQFETGV